MTSHYSFQSFSNYCSASYESIVNSSYYQQLADAKETFFHFTRRLSEAEYSGVAYKAVPAILGAYVGYTGLQTLKTAILGYDSSEMKRAFRAKAYNPAISFSEKISLYSQGVFGSMKSQVRAQLIAESVARFLLSAALIMPLFAKSNTDPIPDVEQIKAYKPTLRQEEHAAAISGTSKAFNLHSSCEIYNEYEGSFGRMWKKSLMHPEIDEKAQRFATAVLDAPTGQPTATEQLQSGIKGICNWTLGFTPWANQCEVLTPNVSKPLFSKMNQGGTFINEDVLEQSCSATLTFIAEDPQALSYSAQMQQKAGAVCDYFKSSVCSSLTTSLPTTPNPSLKDLLTQTCNVIPAPTLSLAARIRSYACDKVCAFSNNTSFFTHPMQERQTLTAFVTDVCNALKLRAQTNRFLMPSQMNALSTQTRLEELYGVAKDIAKLSSPLSGSSSSPLQEILETKPDMFASFIRNFFNIKDEVPLTDRTIHKAFTQLSLKYHPDKCADNEKDACSAIFAAAKILDELTKNQALEGSSSSFYSLKEFANLLANYFQS